MQERMQICCGRTKTSQRSLPWPCELASLHNIHYAKWKYYWGLARLWLGSKFGKPSGPSMEAMFTVEKSLQPTQINRTTEAVDFAQLWINAGIPSQV